MAECTFVSQFRKETQATNEISSESQDDAAAPKRQKELVKLKYLRRRRRFRKRAEKTHASSSDSEPPNSARQSVELLSLCDSRRFSVGGGNITYTPNSSYHLATSFSNQQQLNRATSSSFLESTETLTDRHCLIQNAAVAGGCDISRASTKNLLDTVSIELEFQKSSNNCELKEAKTTNWYSNLFGSIFDYVAGHLFSSKDNATTDNDFEQDYAQDFCENVEEMAERVIQRTVEFCPQLLVDELKQKCTLPLKHKLNQRGVTIGICGKSHHAKKILMKIIERRASDIGNVSYRLCCCPSMEEETLSFLEANHSQTYFLAEQATCAAYVYILDQDTGDSLDTLKWLVDRDKDMITQGRLLLLASQMQQFLTPLPSSHTSSPSNIASPSHVTSNAQSSIITSCTNASHNNHDPNTAPSPAGTVSRSLVTHSTPSSLAVTNTCSVPDQRMYSLSETVHRIQFHPELRTQEHRAVAKMRIQTFVESTVGVSVPKSCVLLYPLGWIDDDNSQFASNDDGSCEADGCGKGEGLCESRNDPTNSNDDKVQSLMNGQVGLGQWLRRFSENCEKLRQLSITSDALHCIEQCCGKLQCWLDDLDEEITRQEELLVHKNHLMVEMKQLWSFLEMQAKDSSLCNELSFCYDRDIEASVLAIEEFAVGILERFQAICISKLEQLSLDNKHWSVKDVCQLFRTDVEEYTRETIQCLNTVHSTLLFLNMQGALQRRCCSFEEFRTLKQLSDAYLSTGQSSDGSSSSDATSYYQDRNWSIYPCGLETMGCDTCMAVEPITITDVFYSVLLSLASKVLKSWEKLVKSELKKLTKTFVKQCLQFLKSDLTKGKAVQFHMNVVSSLILKHFDVFREKTLPQFKQINQLLESNLSAAKEEYKVTEIRFKHLINMKVYLELKKSFLSCCLK